MVMYNRIDDAGYCEDTTDDRTDLNQEVENVARSLRVLHGYRGEVISGRVKKNPSQAHLKKIAGIICVLISLLFAVN